MASKGSRLVSEAKKLSEDMESGIYTHGTEPGKGGAMTSSYPRGGLQARDPRDELVSEKAQFMREAGGTGMTPFGQVMATDRDFEWLRKKRETEAFANLDAWIGKNFHKPDPATRKWLQETFPEYYESRERIMTDRAKLALRINLIKLRGPKNEKDLMLIWALQTGRVKLDRDWDRVGPSQQSPDMGEEQRRFKDGLFSLRRYLSETDRLKNAVGQVPGAAPNPFEPEGQGLDEFQSDRQRFPGKYVPDEGRYPAFLNDVLKPYF